MHEHGFLHRDIKPANVLLADRRIDTRIRGKLTDFGIATLIGIPNLGEQSTGTVAYLSPEQVDQQARRPPPTSTRSGWCCSRRSPGRSPSRDRSRRRRSPGSSATRGSRRASRAALADVLLRRMTALLPEDRPDLDEVALAFQNAFVQDLVAARPGRPASCWRRTRSGGSPRSAATTSSTPRRTTRSTASRRSPAGCSTSRPRSSRSSTATGSGSSPAGASRSPSSTATSRSAPSTVATGAPAPGRGRAGGRRFAGQPDRPRAPRAARVRLRAAHDQDGHAIGTLCVFDRRAGRSPTRSSTTSTCSRRSRCGSSICGSPSRRALSSG